jgi:16S rRNA (cytidine1402-2'-O)-methyltransferase
MQDMGKLYVVATPIGNLEDITLRALSVLKSVSLIAAEDTRHSKKLLHHYNIHTPLLSLHAHNEKKQSLSLLDSLRNNKNVAYITDAGTPLISDPGAYLVDLVRQAGFVVTPIPGPCAAIAALSVAGLAKPQFYFEGFLPSNHLVRQRKLSQLKRVTATVVFYESTHRILETLHDILAIFGNCEAILARELTKQFETLLSGTVERLLEILTTSPEQRLGELVVIIPYRQDSQEVLAKEKVVETLKLLLDELSVKQAVRMGSKLLGISKNELYTIAITLKKGLEK